MLPEQIQTLIGRKYMFQDGNSLYIREAKRRDENQYWVTYETVTGPGIPQKYVMEFTEFITTYGHLFPGST